MRAVCRENPMLRRSFAAGLGALALSARAQGGARSFAVVSEFARDINVVVFQESTGTRLGNNLNDKIPVTGGAFDKLALTSAKQSIDKGERGAPVWLIAPLDSDLIDARTVFVEGGVVKLPDDLTAAMKERGTTHLVTFTRLRDQANLRAVNGRQGTGTLEGLGFYIDRLTEVKNQATLTTTTGFIAPYLYMRASLIDARSGKVLAMRRIVEGEILAAAHAEQGRDPWNVMRPEEKIRHLSELVQREIGKAVPELLAAR
jgi:hypothetical protein